MIHVGFKFFSFFIFIVTQILNAEELKDIKVIDLSSEMSIPQCAQRELEKKILYLGSKYCSHCKKAQPVIEKIIKELDFSKIYKSFDLSDSNDSIAVQKYKIHVLYTPTLIVDCKVYIGDKPESEFKKIISAFKKI